MRNYKKTERIEERQNWPGEQFSESLYHADCVFLLFGDLSFTSYTEHKMADNPRQEISKIPY
jgi:hypothetical protein